MSDDNKPYSNPEDLSDGLQRREVKEEDYSIKERDTDGGEGGEGGSGGAPMRPAGAGLFSSGGFGGHRELPPYTTLEAMKGILKKAIKRGGKALPAVMMMLGQEEEMIKRGLSEPEEASSTEKSTTSRSGPGR